MYIYVYYTYGHKYTYIFFNMCMYIYIYMSIYTYITHIPQSNFPTVLGAPHLLHLSSTEGSLSCR